MFSALVRELNEQLQEQGISLAMFTEFDFEQDKGEETWNTYKNIGVFYTNYGQLNILPGNQGLDGSAQLDLLLQIPNGVKSEAVIIEPFMKLAELSNGIVIDENVTESAGGTSQTITYSYFLNFHVPTTDGDIEIHGKDGMRYIRYSMPVEITMRRQMMFGEDFTINFKTSAETSYTTLNNAFDVVLTPGVQLDSKAMTNSKRTKSEAVSAVWGMQMSVYFDPNDTLHKAIYDALNDAPYTLWNIAYSLPNEDTDRVRTVIMHTPAFSFKRGQLATMTFSVSEAI